MNRRVRVHGVDKGHVVDAGREVREEAGDPLPTLTVLFEAPLRTDHATLVLGATTTAGLHVDGLAVERHVEVAADEDGLALEVRLLEVADGLLRGLDLERRAGHLRGRARLGHGGLGEERAGGEGRGGGGESSHRVVCLREFVRVRRRSDFASEKKRTSRAVASEQQRTRTHEATTGKRATLVVELYGAQSDLVISTYAYVRTAREITIFFSRPRQRSVLSLGGGATQPPRGITSRVHNSKDRLQRKERASRPLFYRRSAASARRRARCSWPVFGPGRSAPSDR